MSEATHYSIKGVTRKSILMMSILGITLIGFWKWFAPSLQDAVISNLVTMILISSVIAPLSLLTFIHFYAGDDADRLCVESSQLIKHMAMIAIVDTAMTAVFGQVLSISPTANPSAYFLSFIFIVIGCAVFLFNIQEIRDQLESESSPSQSWGDSFWLMSSTFWVLIVAFFFLGRNKRN